MVTPQNGKPEPSRIIGSISKFAGTLVGTAMVTGKRIIDSVTPPSEGSLGKPREKTTQARSQTKKAVRKTKAKVPKTKKKKKKVAKRKGTGSSDRSGASKKKSTQSPAKKKKGAKPKKKPVKSEGSSRSRDSLISEVGTGMDVPVGKIAEAEMASEKSSST